MKIEITEDFRKVFKKGTIYNLDLKPGEITYMIGPMGCGKSTLMNALRAKKDSMKSFNEKKFDGMGGLDFTTRIIDVIAFTKIHDYDFDKACFIDIVTDNPSSFYNSATAFGFINGGGMSMQHISRGQGSERMFVQFISEIVECIGEKSDERILICFDEIDEGFDIQAQIRFSMFLNKLLIEKRYPNASIIFISHSIITALSGMKETNVKYFNVKDNCYTTPEKYFEEQTGYNISLTKSE